MKRFTPEQVLEAYHETGLHPAPGVIFDPDKGLACALGAMYRHAGWRRDQSCRLWLDWSG